VRVVEEREEQTDGDGVDLVARDEVDRRVDVAVLERRHHPSLRVDALAHLEAEVAWHQGRRRVLEEVVETGAGRAPELQHVATAARGDERGARALALQQRVGDDGGGVGQPADVGGGDTVAAHRDAEPLHHSVREVARRGRHLDHRRRPARLVGEDDVGERPADVHADAPAHRASSTTAGRAAKPPGR
jgi:hypothetical protein